jgi:hypothetical protein
MKQGSGPLILLALLFGVIGSVEGAPTSEPSDSIRVRLPQDATLSDSLSILRSETRRLVLVEPPYAADRRPWAAPIDAPVIDAVKAIAIRWELYWRVRPGVVLLQPRFTDPRQDPLVEIEELRAVSADLHRLLAPLSPYPLDERFTRDQNEFYESLTSDQLAALRKPGGVPFKQLSAMQQQHWLRVNNAAEYCDREMMFERAQRMYGSWARAGLTQLSQEDGTRALCFNFPDQQGKADGERLYFPQPDASAVGSPAGAADGGELLGAPPVLARNFDQVVSLPDGETTISACMAAVRKSSGSEVVIPRYARERRVLVFSAAKTSAADLVGALADLFGWQLQFDSGHRWTLDRPKLVPAKDPRDLHRKLKAAVPPELHLLLRTELQDLAVRQARYQRQFQVISTAL